MTSRSGAVCALAFALLISLIPWAPRRATADLISVDGTERTTVNLVDRFVLHVPERILEMTVHIPIPDPAQAGVRASYCGFQSVGDLSVTSSQKPYDVREERDPSGNLYKVLTYHHPAAGDITIETDFRHLAVAEDIGTNAPANRLPLRSVPTDTAIYLQPSRRVQSDDPQIVALARQLSRGCDTEYDVSERIAQWLQMNIRYGGFSGGDFNDAVSTLNNREGLCEGWAQLFIALARANGIPARFVGGYMIGGSIRYPISQDGRSTITVESQPLSHGWVELWYPDAGWVPYDPQGSAGFVDSHHVRVWVGVDASAVAPLVTWLADTGEQLSFAEEQSQGRVTDNISVQYASSSLGLSHQILLTR